MDDCYSMALLVDVGCGHKYRHVAILRAVPLTSEVSLEEYLDEGCKSCRARDLVERVEAIERRSGVANGEVQTNSGSAATRRAWLLEKALNSGLDSHLRVSNGYKTTAWQEDDGAPRSGTCDMATRRMPRVGA